MLTQRIINRVKENKSLWVVKVRPALINVELIFAFKSASRFKIWKTRHHQMIILNLRLLLITKGMFALKLLKSVRVTFQNLLRTGSPSEPPWQAVRWTTASRGQNEWNCQHVNYLGIWRTELKYTKAFPHAQQRQKSENMTRVPLKIRGCRKKKKRYTSARFKLSVSDCPRLLGSVWDH